MPSENVLADGLLSHIIRQRIPHLKKVAGQVNWTSSVVRQRVVDWQL